MRRTARLAGAAKLTMGIVAALRARPLFAHHSHANPHCWIQVLVVDLQNPPSEPVEWVLRWLRHSSCFVTAGSLTVSSRGTRSPWSSIRCATAGLLTRSCRQPHRRQ